MQEPITYFLDQSNGTVDLTLTGERFTAKTKGKGLIDKPRSIDIALSDLTNFCLVPTIGPQNLVSKGFADYSYDSELIFSYRVGKQIKKKRGVFVNSQNDSFKILLENLGRACPSASLMHLEPAEAQKQMGVLSATKAVYIVVSLLLGVPLVIALALIISKLLSR